MRESHYDEDCYLEERYGEEEMTEIEIKKMLKDIINNGAEYEFRWLRTDGWSDWKPYKLGEEILCNDSRYEYRKIEKYIVLFDMNLNLEIELKSKLPNLKTFQFEGSKEECEKWIKEHKKTWLDKRFPLGFMVDDLHMEGEKERLGVTEVCKKILEEIYKYSYVVYDEDEYGDCFETKVINISDIYKIINDLGVEL